VVTDVKVATPVDVPEVEDRSRSVRMLWPVGKPDEQGYQTYAELAVRHDGNPRYRYEVELRQTKIKREGIWVSEMFSVFGRKIERISSTPTKRYNGPRMRQLLDTALTDIRARHQAGDVVISGYFELDDQARG